MDELLVLILVFAVVLTIITLVGHGIWVLIARLVGGSDEPPLPPITPSVRSRAAIRDRCPRCLALHHPDRDQCLVCGWPEDSPSHADSDAALSALGRQLDQFRKIGMLDTESDQRIAEIIAAQRNRLFEAKAAWLAEEEEIAEQTADLQQPVVLTPEPPTTESTPPPVRPTSPFPEPPATPSLVDPAARARKYAASREVAATESRAAAVAKAAAPPPPRRREAFSKLFAAFMEEKNIRWGELVGGLLIICGSIALVISFWSQIAAQPLLEFFLFGGVTAGLFGIGLYTEKRWKLHTTSRGVLIIATLLVPLNFLAIAAFTSAPTTGSAATAALLTGEVISIGLFAFLVFLAAKTIVPAAPLLVAIGVMVPSVVQLLVRRWVDPAATLAVVYALAALPIACYLTVTGLHVRRTIRGEDFGESEANALFILLGVVSYALLLPIGLALFKTQAPGNTLHWLAPLVGLIGTPALATGLVFWRRMTDPEHASIRTSGLAVGVLGAGIMAVATFVAWPDPAVLLPVAIVNAIVFAAIAIWFELPAAHLVSGVSLAAAWLVGFHVVAGHVAWNVVAPAAMLRALLSAASGTALVPLVAIFGAAAALWHRAGRSDDAIWTGICATPVALVSLVLVSWFGFGVPGDPHHVAWVCGLYGFGALIAAWFVADRAISWVASGLLLAAVVQTVVFGLAERNLFFHPWASAFLVHATLAAVIAGIARTLRRGGPLPVLAETFAHSGVGSSAIMAGLMTATIWTWPVATAAWHLYWLAGVGLAIAFICDWPRLFTAFQTALTVAIPFTVAAILSGREWYAAARWPWRDPRFLQATGTALAGYCIAWTAVRLGLRRFARGLEDSPGWPGLDRREAGESDDHPPTSQLQLEAQSLAVGTNRFLNPRWLAVDHLVAMAVVALLITLATYAAVPGTAQELSPRSAVVAGGPATRIVPPATQFELPGLPHRHTAGAWILLAAVGAMLLVGMWEWAAAWRWMGLLVAAAAVCPLLAMRFEPDVSVASALRWCLAGFFAVGSVPIWFRKPVAAGASRIGWERREVIFKAYPLTGVPLNRAARTGILAIVVVPLVAMALYVSVAAIYRAGIDPQIGQLVLWLGATFVVVAGAGLLLRANPSPADGGGGSETDFSPADGGGGQTSARTLASHVLLLVGFAPLAVALLFAVAAALRKFPIIGPNPDAWFREVGFAVSYAVPILAMAAVLVGHAIRERDSRYAFSAGLLFNLGVTAAYLLGLSGLDSVAWIRIAQINAVVSAAFSLAWLAAISWYWRRQESHPPRDRPLLLVTTVALAAALCILSLVPAVVWLVVEPLPPTWVGEAGHLLGWISLLLTAAAIGWLQRERPQTISIHAIAGSILVAVALVTLTAERLAPGEWLGYHILLAGTAAAAWLATAPRPGRSQRPGPLEPNPPPPSSGEGLGVGVFEHPTAPRPGRSEPNPPPPSSGEGLGVGVFEHPTTPRPGPSEPNPPPPSSGEGLGVGVLEHPTTPRPGPSEPNPPPPSSGEGLGVGVLEHPTAQRPGRSERPGRLNHQATSTALGAATIFLSLRALWGDPAAPWWTIAGLLAMSALAAVLAAQTARRIHVYVAGILLNLVVSIWWIDSGYRLTSPRGPAGLFEFLLVNILALTLPVIAWVLLERQYIRPARDRQITRRGIGFHRVASSLAVILLTLIAGLGLFAEDSGGLFGASAILTWAALAATTVAVVACLWDPATRFAVAHLHLLGLAAVAILLDELNLQGPLFDWGLTLVMAAYSLGTSYVWSRRGGLWRLAESLGMPQRDAVQKKATAGDLAAADAPIVRPGLGWIVPANLLIAVGVTLSAFRIVLSFDDFHQRWSVAKAVIAQAFAVGMLARGRVRSSLQYGALLFGVLGAIVFGLAWLPVDVEGPVLHRMVVVAVALAAMSVLYGFGLVKLIRRENEWTRAAARFMPVLAALAILAILFVLGIEVAEFASTREVSIGWPALVAVAIALGGLAISALAAAVLPGRDPLGLSERGRQVYVYTAEILLALLFLHIRITMPWLFSGWFLRVWPLVVMLIAFVGVGLAEWFRRRRQHVLSQPLETTGALLPLLPVIGCIFIPSEMNFSLVLLAVAALYSTLAVLRKSFAFAVLAALAANGSLWYLLHDMGGLGLAEHPQLWLIPPALCVLIAAQLNRKQLSDAQMTTIRYLASIVIYVSSTADVILIGVAEAPWLPLVLAAVSLMGIFAGILLRIRAFLYLGTAFLLVSLFSYIWYAAVDLEATWIWWVTVVATGVAILVLFAIFEKKRDDVIKLVEGLRHWE